MLSYDVIFAGGGAAGCVTAGRLAAAAPHLRILIIEAGPRTKDNPTHVQPARYLANLLKPGDTFSHHVAKPSEAVNGRAVVIPAGRCMGGGSSVNFMMYTRASASDYDDWEKFGNKGWGSKDLIPLANKAETYETNPSAPNHGFSGPIKVSQRETNISQQFLAAAAAYDKDRSCVEDANNFHTGNAYSKWNGYISAKTGTRSDTAHHFIYTQEQNKNLTVLARHRVTRVIFEGNKAVGVEYVDDASRTQGQVPLQAFASKLVVLSSGSFGSVAILERSGIGSKQVLSKYSIPQLVDLPGVGENYNDHNLLSVAFNASDEAETMDEVLHGTEDEIKPYVDEWQREGKGPLAHNAIDAAVKMRPSAEDLEQLGPEFRTRWKEFFLNALDKPAMLMVPFCGSINPKAPPSKYFTMIYYTAYPLAVGHVHVQSGSDPYAPLDVQAGYLEHVADVTVLRWAYKHGRELARRMKFYRGEFAESHPKFPDGSPAAVGLAPGPADTAAAKIMYTPEDDQAIDDFHRSTVGTTWHALGTCAMKPREQGGVVDPKLNVYDVTNLKVADLSICPSNVGANTYNTALIVGEKAAVIIASELGINL